MHVQPFVPWRSILPCDIPSFGFAGQSITAACSAMLAGPALSAFAIFPSSECADVVNVPGVRGAVAVERSSAKATDDIAVRTIAPYRKSLVMRASVILDLISSRSGVHGNRRSGAITITDSIAIKTLEGPSVAVTLSSRRATTRRRVGKTKSSEVLWSV